MSTTLAEAPMTESTSSEGRFQHAFDPTESDFSYRPIPMSAMIGSVLAVLSITALLMWLAIPVAIVAAVVCLVAVVTIARSQGELAGLWLAAGGFVLASIMAVAGVLLTVHRYKTEMPPGYERVSFAHDISARGIGQQEVNGGIGMVIPEEVKALVGKDIYLKGFMYPTGRRYDITDFLLCKDNAQCCFGGQPALQDMIAVRLNDNKTTIHSDSLVGVAGKLQLNQEYRGGNLEPIYILDAEYTSEALTSL
ncbi:MAG: hypothetical protein ACK5Q5_22955 [Planctomycetaceae bacterium]